MGNTLSGLAVNGGEHRAPEPALPSWPKAYETKASADADAADEKMEVFDPPRVGAKRRLAPTGDPLPKRVPANASAETVAEYIEACRDWTFRLGQSAHQFLSDQHDSASFAVLLEYQKAVDACMSLYDELKAVAKARRPADEWLAYIEKKMQDCLLADQNFRKAIRQKQPLRTGMEAHLALTDLWSQWTRMRQEWATEQKKMGLPVPPWEFQPFKAAELTGDVQNVIASYFGHKCTPVPIDRPIFNPENANNNNDDDDDEEGLEEAELFGIGANHIKCKQKGVVIVGIQLPRAIVLLRYDYTRVKDPSAGPNDEKTISKMHFALTGRAWVPADASARPTMCVGHDKVVLHISSDAWYVYDIQQSQGLKLQKRTTPAAGFLAVPLAFSATDRDVVYFCASGLINARKLSTGAVLRVRPNPEHNMLTLLHDEQTHQLWGSSSTRVLQFDSEYAPRFHPQQKGAQLFAYYKPGEAMFPACSTPDGRTTIWNNNGTVLETHQTAVNTPIKGRAWQCADFSGYGYFRIFLRGTELLASHCVTTP